ncbi:MAG TPA: Bro-N domain-containing protein [Oscillospiraceae bacterium]|nr:Bro-N domain-containing protein [Oscillospiraceae bacterium]
MTNLKVFDNSEFGTIRAIEKDGEPWFIGKDAADALGYQNGSKAISVHVDDEDKNLEMLPQSQNGNLVTQTAIINESGLYSLIFSSKLPKAKEFKHWVTSEVLPSIRKTGTYALKEFPPKSTSAGEAASLIKRLDDIAKAKKCSGDERAIIANAICKQCGITLPECFTRVNQYEQFALVRVIQ